MTAKTLPERLRHYTADPQLADNYCEDMHAAADEIERLRMDLENTRAEAVLAVATERERCAKLCDPANADRPEDWTEYAEVRAECAARIRGA